MNDSESQKSWGDESSQSDWTESLEAKDQQKVIYTDLFEKYERSV